MVNILSKMDWITYLKFCAALEPDTITRAHLLLEAPQIAATKSGRPPHLPEYKKLMTISGIGESKAKELAAAGFTFENIRDRLDVLPRESQIFFKYRPVTEIPAHLAQSIAKKLCKKYGTILAGSVRRGAEFSKDVDLILIGGTTKSTNNTDANPATSVASRLKISPLLVISDGPDRCSFLYKQKKGQSNQYFKVDLFYTTKEEFPFMLLYLTGSKEFNIRMRAHAKSRGLLLNQKGLYQNGRSILRAQNEREIFARIDMKWVPPERR